MLYTKWPISRKWFRRHTTKTNYTNEEVDVGDDNGDDDVGDDINDNRDDDYGGIEVKDTSFF